MSGDSEDEDLSAIAWPGFVDILSSVIIMFVFFLMIVAGALVIHVMIYISRVKSDIIAEHVQSEFEFEFAQQQTEFAESDEQDANYDEEEREILVSFGTDAISILPETKTLIAGILEKYDPEDYVFHVISPKSTNPLDITHSKVAVARMLNLRNTLLEAGFPASSAIPKLVKGYEIDESLDWCKIKIIKR